MEDRDEKTGADPELEAHRKKRSLKATEEASAGSTEEEAKDEESGDVELHTTTRTTTTRTTT